MNRNFRRFKALRHLPIAGFWGLIYLMTWPFAKLYEITKRKENEQG